MALTPHLIQSQQLVVVVLVAQVVLGLQLAAQAVERAYLALALMVLPVMIQQLHHRKAMLAVEMLLMLLQHLLLQALPDMAEVVVVAHQQMEVLEGLVRRTPEVLEAQVLQTQLLDQLQVSCQVVFITLLAVVEVEGMKPLLLQPHKQLVELADLEAAGLAVLA